MVFNKNQNHNFWSCARLYKVISPSLCAQPYIFTLYPDLNLDLCSMNTISFLVFDTLQINFLFFFTAQSTQHRTSQNKLKTFLIFCYLESKFFTSHKKILSVRPSKILAKFFLVYSFINQKTLFECKPYKDGFFCLNEVCPLRSLKITYIYMVTYALIFLYIFFKKM